MTKKTKANKVKLEDLVTTSKEKEHLIYKTLIFCAFCVLYCMFRGIDSELYRTIVTSSMTLAGAVIGIFVTGRTFNDISMAKIAGPIDPTPTKDITNG